LLKSKVMGLIYNNFIVIIFNNVIVIPNRAIELNRYIHL